MINGMQPLIIGNWKMNPASVSLALKLGKELKKSIGAISEVDVVLAPPHVYLSGLKLIQDGKEPFILGAQDVFYEKSGAHTGEISIPMLKDFGVKYIIIGHSERRIAGENDEQVNKKLIAILKEGLIGVVCVGEIVRDQNGHYLSHIESQIRRAFATVSKNRLSHIVIAYEPIWAIGTGNTATAGDVHEMKLFIVKVLTDLYGRNFAQKVRILYGGSVHEKNAYELFVEGTVDGFLVGGASLQVREFTTIVKSVVRHG